MTSPSRSRLRRSLEFFRSFMTGNIRRRHILYIKGYDQLGADDYYDLFVREHARFLKMWGIAGSVAPIVREEPAIHWSASTRGPNWDVATTFEFLDWNDIIESDLKRSTWGRYPRAWAYYADYLFSGTLWRVFRANWRYGVFHLYPVVVLSLAAAAPVLLAVWAYLGLQDRIGPGAAIAAAALLALIVGWLGLRAADRGFANQLAEGWIWCRDGMTGKRANTEARVDAFARHIVARLRGGECDEVVVVGHSAGGLMALWSVARALELWKDRAGAPRLVLATVGSVHALAALDPRDQATRAAVAKLASAKDLLWADFQARKDVISFFDFDSVDDTEIQLPGPRVNPVVFLVSMRDLFTESYYGGLRRWNVLRIHHQFIMANSRRARYDFFMMICGPLPVATWARDDWMAPMSFDAHAAHVQPQVGGDRA